MRILLCGADGRMGKAVTELAHQRGDTIVCGLSLVQDLSGPFPVYNSFDAVTQAADVLLDFS
ncbi:MAG TPA: 4-hydroxy-tetrahydrodipicolinate reductase, partial [Clostridiales bacterium]|nr:4-hydroxy-tetrahydrodipicolinate reductase [Clostridiales bacterium]